MRVWPRFLISPLHKASRGELRRSIIQRRLAPGRRVQRSLHAPGEPIFSQATPLQTAWLMGSPCSVDAGLTVSRQLRRQRQALLQREGQVEQPALVQLKEQ